MEVGVGKIYGKYDICYNLRNHKINEIECIINSNICKTDVQNGIIYHKNTMHKLKYNTKSHPCKKKNKTIHLDQHFLYTKCSLMYNKQCLIVNQ